MGWKIWIFVCLAMVLSWAFAEEILPETGYMPEGAAFEIVEGGRRYEDVETGGFWLIEDKDGVVSGVFEMAAEEGFSAAEFVSTRWEDALIIRDSEDGLIFAAAGMAGICTVREGSCWVSVSFGSYIDNEKLTRDGAEAVLLMMRPECVVSEMEMDSDDGLLIYEGEALAGGAEYEFEIDAYTGRLLEWERD